VLMKIWTHNIVIVHTPAHPVISAFTSMFTRCCIAVPHVAIYMLDIVVMFVAMQVYDCFFMRDVQE